MSTPLEPRGPNVTLVARLKAEAACECWTKATRDLFREAADALEDGQRRDEADTVQWNDDCLWGVVKHAKSVAPSE